MTHSTYPGNDNLLREHTSIGIFKPSPDISLPSQYIKPGFIKPIIDEHLQFVSALAHEVRNPLTNITLSVEMMRSLVNDNALKVYLDIINRNAIRVNELITEMLKYKEEDEAPNEEQSIHQLLDDSLDQVKDKIAIKNITVRKEYAMRDFKIVLNRPKMKMALTNIIVNAIEAMSAVTGKLTVVTKSTIDKHVIQIQDNGCGISKDNLKKIFRPYFTNKAGGMGLGLATTYDTLLSNRVAVKVISEEGLGSRFTLLFDTGNNAKGQQPVIDKRAPALSLSKTN